MAKIEDNRLIVEFVDGRPDKRPPIQKDHFLFPDLNIPGSHHISEFRFDKDWAWLIPLMSRIKDKCEEDDIDLFGDYQTETWDIEDCIWNDSPEYAFMCIVRLIKDIKEKHYEDSQCGVCGGVKKSYDSNGDAETCWGCKGKGTILKTK